MCVSLFVTYFSRRGINKRGRSPPKSIPKAADRIVGSSKDAIISAKILTKFSKENSNLKILGGIMGDEILDVEAVQNVATLPTLDEARAKIVGILRSPAQKLATILLAPATKIAILTSEKSKK